MCSTSAACSEADRKSNISKKEALARAARIKGITGHLSAML